MSHLVGAWVAHRLHGSHEPEYQAIGLEHDGCLIAGARFENWTGTSIVCHIAAAGRFTRSFLWTLSRFAFIQCGVSKLIAPVYSDNMRSLEMIRKMGFIEETRLKDAQPKGDIIFFVLTPDRCRFLSPRYHRYWIGS